MLETLNVSSFGGGDDMKLRIKRTSRTARPRLDIARDIFLAFDIILATLLSKWITFKTKSVVSVYKRKNIMVRQFVKVALGCALFILPVASAWSQQDPAVPDHDLIEGARAGDLSQIFLALSNGINVDDRGRDRIPALIIAAERGHTEAVTYLLQRGASVDIRAGDRQTALGSAVSRNRIEVVDVLLKQGADPNRTAANNEIALIIAARQGFSELVDLLLEYGADKYETDRTGRTALDWARDKRFTDIEKIILADRSEPE
jgi:hypothetical protein